jgi:N-acetylmuramoyl-L-alanine amidase
MAMRIVECRSPNHDVRPEDGSVDTLVLHYTGMRTADEALARLTDPDAKVSAHYTIDRDGRVFRHVVEERRAWHAGVSWWAGSSDINSRSIGIELVNPGHEFGYEPFPKAQISALIDLADGILRRYPIPAHRVLGHSDVAPARKLDPGELFPWEQLAEFGIGAWPEHSGPLFPLLFTGELLTEASETEATHVEEFPFSAVAPRTPEDMSSVSDVEKNVTPKVARNFDFASALALYGYGVAPEVDIPLATVVAAFQRHFRPEKIDGVCDRETEYRLAALIDVLEH